MSESMIERVAKAMFPHFWDENMEGDDPYLMPKIRGTAREKARAAIEAMREPTFEMVEAPAAIEIDPGTADDVWRAMISKAMEG